MALSWAEILAAEDLPREAVAVPEWGGEVHVRTLTGAERAAFEMENVRLRRLSKDDESWYRDYGIRLLALALCSEAGAPLVGPDGVAALGGKSAVVLDRLIEVAVRLNGLRAKDLERVAGESEGTPSGGPGSG